MKKILILLTLVAFVVAVPMAAVAAVKCCADGKVMDVADKAACDKAKGKVVKDAAECKPAPAPAKPK